MDLGGYIGYYLLSPDEYPSVNPSDPETVLAQFLQEPGSYQVIPPARTKNKHVANVSTDGRYGRDIL